MSAFDAMATSGFLAPVTMISSRLLSASGAGCARAPAERPRQDALSNAPVSLAKLFIIHPLRQSRGAISIYAIDSQYH